MGTVVPSIDHPARHALPPRLDLLHFPGADSRYQQGPAFLETRTFADRGQGQVVHLCGLFPYRDELRRAILNAKVGGKGGPLMWLRELWGQHAFPREIADRCGGIGAVAPSLWSRLRGRTDLAGVLAFDLRRATRRPHWALPGGQRWRVGKRSFLGSRRQRGSRDETQHTVNTDKIIQAILLVDDVLTTGFTMESLAKKIDATEVWCIALAVTPR